MMRIAATAVFAMGLGACLAAGSEQTSTTEQDTTGRTCAPLIDTGKGGYWGCEVQDAGGPYIITGVSQADCTTCGLAVSRAVCSQYGDPPELPYCTSHGGGGGGGSGGFSGNPCGNGCFQDASLVCHCGFEV